jgi:DNA-damage-inducible protein J
MAQENININIRVDKVIKEQAEVLFSNLGMNMSTAVNVFLRQSLAVRGIPFDVKEDPYLTTPEEDDYDLRAYKKAMAAHKANPVTYTHEEVRKMLELD